MRTTLSIVAITCILPYNPMGTIFEFTPIPSSFLLMMLVIAAFYTFAAEVVKKAFYAKVKF